MIRIGSLFSGIGGFELGLERSIPNSETIWQVEQNPFCQRVLKQHWSDATIYDDVCSVGKHNLEPVDILCGGFPCQDISIAGAKGGINASRSGLWWEMCRVISELEPPVIVLENVPNVLRLGGREVPVCLSTYYRKRTFEVCREEAGANRPVRHTSILHHQKIHSKWIKE